MIDDPVDFIAWKKRSQALQESLHALDGTADGADRSKKQSKADKAKPANNKVIPAAQSLIH
jgi:hypothetical protein